MPLPPELPAPNEKEGVVYRAAQPEFDGKSEHCIFQHLGNATLGSYFQLDGYSVGFCSNQEVRLHRVVQSKLRVYIPPVQCERALAGDTERDLKNACDQ